MMAQYHRIKSELPRDALLLFRLGDFYEMFFDDAQKGAAVLNLALTQRQGIPMCGLPFHAAQGYIARLLKHGHKVAICDQLEEARPGKLVKRDVTQILSPGTHFDERMLSAEQNNYLAAISQAGSRFGLALIDLTTASFRVTELADASALTTELLRVRPAEIIFPSNQPALETLLASHDTPAHPHDGWTFEPSAAEFALRDHFRVQSVDGFGLRGLPAALGAAGAALHYLTQHLRRNITQLTSLSVYETSRFLHLDAATLRHLEVLEAPDRDAPGARHLCGALQRTQTPMGARLLRDWLSQPLAELDGILARQDAVQSWLTRPDLLGEVRESLRGVRDLERTLGRLCAGSGGARDLGVLRQGLGRVPVIQQLCQAATTGPEALLTRLAESLSHEPDLGDLIARAIVDDPPAGVKEGGLIREGFHPELDELRRAQREGQDWIARLQQQEIDRTGIPSLKIRFNSVFGYYLEVTRANLDKVPQDYIRKQTVANGERFITPALKEMEGRILGAEERAMKLEYALFQQVREQVIARTAPIQTTAAALAQIDVLASFAESARLGGYTRPEIADDGELRITEGRHPVLEQSLSGETFTPNDTELDLEHSQIAIITGPNMAGKSTYIRQVALLALLAHTGSFLPARSARIGLVDRIFTRIGASDNLARGQSTFMVEMSETANILNNATRRSLVILDEIGRGTSTFDGLSLAWSIVEHLHNVVGARTLFATHYHELTELAGRLPRLRNFNVAVREWNDQIVFLHQIVAGGTDKSYGIQVARLAGVPRPVIARAKQILRVLEEAELDLQRVVDSGDSSEPAPPSPRPSRNRHRAEREKLRALPSDAQLDLFAAPPRAPSVTADAPPTDPPTAPASSPAP
ncbi:MAG: DNA mismatch repair protein MutS [Verrucomicrobiales bacterium]|nr:DNA mismatch repair protein MutS [Verrucomicrobiales bacterium]